MPWTRSVSILVDTLLRRIWNLILFTHPQSDRHGNTALAFDVAEQHLGIPVSTALQGIYAEMVKLMSYLE